MKKNFALFAVLTMLCATAFATGKEPPPPEPPKVPMSAHSSSNSSSQSASQSKSQAAAGAVGVGIGVGGQGGSVGPVSAQGGAGGNAAQRQQQQQGQDLTNTSPSSASLMDSSQSNTNARAWSLFLPPLAFTPPMAPIQGCAPEITQSATGVVFGAYSSASAHTDPQDCTLIALRNAKVETCQYASAKQIEDLMVRKKLPDFQPGTAVFHDYSERECAALKAPPKPAPLVNYVDRPVEKVVEVPVEKVVYLDRPCPDGWKRNSKGVCYDPAWAKKSLACTPANS